MLVGERKFCIVVDHHLSRSNPILKSLMPMVLNTIVVVWANYYHSDVVPSSHYDKWCYRRLGNYCIGEFSHFKLLNVLFLLSRKVEKLFYIV